MPNYELISPNTGQSYRVQADGQLSPQDAEAAVAHFDSVYERNTQNKPFFSVGDTLSGIGDAVGNLPLTTLGAYHRMREGFKRPDLYDPEAQAVFDAEAKLNERMQRESQNRLMRGEASSTGDAFRAAAPSLGSTVGTMAAAVPAGMASGALYGAAVGTAVEPGGGTVVGGLGGAVAGGVGAALAAGGAAYRMAGTQFLNDAFTRLEEEYRKEGKPFTEEDRQNAYQTLRPLAENSALWEAGPEAVTSALTLGTGKLVFGLGKPLVKEVAKTTLGKLGIKAGAVAGDAVAEVAGETATSIGQAPLQAQAEAFAQGNPNWRQEQGPYAGPGGIMQAMRDVTPATLAMQALTLGAAGGIKAATLPFQRAQATTPDTVPPSATPGLEEDTGELTAEDVAELEGQVSSSRFQVPRSEILPGAGAIGPQPGSSRVIDGGSIPPLAPLQPDAGVGQTMSDPLRAPGFRDDPLSTALPAPGDVITDLRIPRRDVAADEFAPEDAGVGQAMSDPASLITDQASLPPASVTQGSGTTADQTVQQAPGAGSSPAAGALSPSLEPLMSRANRLGRGLGEMMPGQVPSSRFQGPSAGQLETSNLPPETLSPAYTAAAQGSSTQMVPLERVLAAAQAQNPGLTAEAFLAQVRQGYENGSVMLEGAGSPQEAQNAGLTLPGTPVGTAVRMMVVPPAGGMTNAEGRMRKDGLESPASQAQGKPIASTSLPTPAVDKAPDAPSGLFRYDARPESSLSPQERGALAAARREDPSVVPVIPTRLAGEQDATPRGLEARAKALYTWQAAFRRLFNKEILFVQGNGDFAGLNGAVASDQQNVILVNIAAPDPLLYILGHELTHTLRRQRPELYAKIEKAVLASGKDLDTFRALLTRLGYKDTQLNEELTADFVGSQFLEPDFLNQLAGEQPSLFARFARAAVDFINGLLKRVVGTFGRDVRPFFTDGLTSLRDELTAALRAYSKSGSFPDNPLTESPGGNLTLADGNGELSKSIPAAPVQNETQSRFASPNEADNLYDVEPVAVAQDAGRAWLAQTPVETAIQFFEQAVVPPGMTQARMFYAHAELIKQLAKAADTGTEIQRMVADEQLTRASRAWHGRESQEWGRAGKARAVASGELSTIAGILAAKELLVDRGKKAVEPRFEGGTEGAVEKVRTIIRYVDRATGEILGGDLGNDRVNGGQGGKVKAKHPKLEAMLNALRKKMYPGMKWADIFTELPATQKERQREIYRRLMLDERLSTLTPDERLALTNELDKAWQRERRKVFLRELEKADVLGEKDAKDREKVKAATPRLLRLMNLGMLNSELFREALAQEYGVKQITAPIAAELRALGERIQTAPEGLPRRKLEQQLVERLQSLVDATLWQTIDSWWTVSVLSGWRTPVDIGLSISNGIEDVGLGSVVTALRTGNKDVAVRALGAMFGRIPSAFMEAVDFVATGNKSMMRNFELETQQALEGGNRLASDVGRALWQKGGWRKVPGGFMVFYGRLMTALDHINSASTREGAKAMALARHPELYEKALRISAADRQAARTQARQELTAGAAPTTRQQRLEEAARIREILEQGTPAEVLAEATEVGRAAALQNDPTGIGGWFMNAVLSAVNTVNLKAKELAARENPDALTVQKARLAGAMAPVVRALTGTKFIRTVANSANRTLSYVPGVGVYAVGQQGRTGAFGDILVAKQVIGTLVGIALYLAFDDDDDEKGIEDGWKDKTPQQKAQLYAQGKQPFTVWTRDERGRVRNWNYQQWGIAGIMNTVAAMLKQKGSEAGTLNVLTNSLLQGAMSFTDKAQLQGIQTILGENFLSTDPVSGVAANLNKWAAQTVGGMVPRLMKDIDNELSPELRATTNWWQRWAKEVPMLRQMSSGKRVNILGEDIRLDRSPLSRVTQVGTADPAYRTLGRLNSRDIYLPDPTTGVRVVRLADGTRRPMTATEKDRYQRLTGAAYRQLLTDEGERLLQMEPEEAQKRIFKTTQRLRDRAAAQAVR